MEKKISRSKAPKTDKDISHSDLVEKICYESKTGNFFWRSNYNVGKPLGYVNYDGYIRMYALGRRYYAHRLAWFYVTGEWPKHEIDHINGDRSDNRISNLREATQNENAQNKRKQRNNKSGVTGVSWNKAEKSWVVKISANGKRIYLGRYSNLSDAIKAREEGKKKYHVFNKSDPLGKHIPYKRAKCRTAGSPPP